MRKNALAKFYLVFLLCSCFLLNTGFAGASGAVFSTFLQMDRAKMSLAAPGWERFFKSLHRLGISEVVIQWSAVNNAPFFRPYDKVRMSLSITDLLNIAKQNQVKLKIGLLHDPEFWVRIKERPKSLNIYFARITHDSLQLAEELFRETDSHPAFAGWYIPQEIDDTNWKKEERRAVLCHFLQEMCSRLKTLSPRAKISISAFSNGELSPQGFSKLWDTIFSSAGIDAIYFQDGIGAGKLDFHSLPIYLEALKNASKKHGIALIPIAELFKIPEPGKGQKQLLPGSLIRIKRQLEIEYKYTDRVSSFGLTELLASKSFPCRDLIKMLQSGEAR